MSATACSGGGAPPPGSPPADPQSPSATSTPSATPTPTASYKPADATGRAQNVPVPELPEAAKAETKEGLEAFARYWFQLLSYGYETGDISRLEPITSPECRACESAKAVISGWHEGGRWLAGGKVQTPSVSTTFKVAPDGNYQVAVQASQQALSYYNADGTLNSTDPKPDDTGNLMLAIYKNGKWYVNNIQPIAG
ncbi:DUF6318 family protein [Arthrobacter sp. ok362]|uniref:DUF6318 family protein n=1 Tax=Arthrobacter sp. ok362 TaxID=1761745 RepID=UPI001113BCA9|nr:DUF6318 family protein [Arthrobacter sp. ok362]